MPYQFFEVLFSLASFYLTMTIVLIIVSTSARHGTEVKWRLLYLSREFTKGLATLLAGYIRRLGLELSSASPAARIQRMAAFALERNLYGTLDGSELICAGLASKRHMVFCFQTGELFLRDEKFHEDTISSLCGFSTPDLALLSATPTETLDSLDPIKRGSDG